MNLIKRMFAAAIVAAVGLFAKTAEAAVIPVPAGDTDALVRALASAAAATEETTIELGEGTYSITAAMNATLAQPVTIRGLGAGAVLDAGGGSLTILTVNNTAALVISNVTMKGSAKGTAFKKTGKGDLTLRDVKVSDNIATTLGMPAADLTGTAAAELFVYDSEFCGNLTTGSGANGPNGGLRATTFKSVTVDNCRFCRNGEQIGSKTIVNSANYMIGAGATFNGAPFTMTRCTFAANRPNIHVTAASVLYVKGNCDGSTVKNCSFVANIAPCYDSDTGKGFDVDGAMVVEMDNDSRTILIQNCTFAYNCFGERSSPAALNITKGAATVKNCLFHRNYCVGTSAPVKPIDIYCRAAGSSFDYCALNSLSATSYSDNLGGGDHLFEISDPKLVATDADFEANVNFTLGSAWPRVATGAKGIDFNDAAAMVSASALSVHLTDYTSDALDKGDPADDYSLEPDFNGMRINLGAYGGTTAAAKSLKGEVDFTMEKDITSDYTQPHAIVTCTGTGVGYARVFFCFGETPGTADSLASWDEKVLIADGAQRAGDVFDAHPMRYFETGTTLYWCVMMVKVDSDDVEKASAVQSDTLTSPTPPWYGVPACPGVIYVRSGATGKGDGLSWTDALTTYNAAYRKLDAEHGEIWLAGDGVYSLVSTSVNKPGRSLVIRGGFSGSEATAADRAAGLMTDLDAAGGSRVFWFEMSDALTIDRINAFGATTAFLTKTGSGAVTLTGCRFAGLKQAGVRDAVSLTGNGTQTVTVRDCVFEDNARTDNASNGGCIRALLIDNYANAVIDGCLFASNGYARTVETAFTSVGGTAGSALCANNVPIAVSNTKFVANTYCCHVTHSSSILAVTGNGAGSSLKNCIFAGNCGLRSDKGQGYSLDLHGVCTVDLANDSDAFSVDNCTFFGNAHIEPGSPVALNLRNCLASVKNSVFFCNISAGTGTKVAADVMTKNSASTIDYCWFADASDAFVGGFAELGVHNVTGETPYLVSGTNDYNEVFSSKITTLPYSSDTKPLILAEPDFNVHLRGKCGYTDEITGQKTEAKMPAGSPMKYSPCVDTGDPESDFSKEAKPAGGRVNIGAYGNTPWSTVSGTGNGLVIFLR